MQSVLDFLRDLAQNNNKPWFDENKKRYESARKDFLTLVEAVIREMDRHLKLPHLQPKDCVFRIYRDVRFSKDKAPYKVNMSMVVSKEGKKGEVLDGIYLHIQPGASFVAMGLYEPGPEELKRVRQEIDFNLDRWKTILEDPQFKRMFGEVSGDRLKTSPKGYDSANPGIEWIRLTRFTVLRPLKDAEVIGSRLPEIVGETFEAAADFRQFIKDALAV